MTLVGLLSAIGGFLKVRFLVDKEVIDNVIFRLHYRITSAILFVCCILCTANSLIGGYLTTWQWWRHIWLLGLNPNEGHQCQFILVPQDTHLHIAVRPSTTIPSTLTLQDDLRIMLPACILDACDSDLGWNTKLSSLRFLVWFLISSKQNPGQYPNWKYDHFMLNLPFWYYTVQVTVTTVHKPK